jgi:hypothetical protein
VKKILKIYSFEKKYYDLIENIILFYDSISLNYEIKNYGVSMDERTFLLKNIHL